jgi:hypothetical protein
VPSVELSGSQAAIPWFGYPVGDRRHLGFGLLGFGLRSFGVLGGCVWMRRLRPWPRQTRGLGENSRRKLTTRARDAHSLQVREIVHD